MSAYQVQHLETTSSFPRPCIFHNPHHVLIPCRSITPPDPAIEAFHRTLPSYAETTLHNLPSIATELGLKHVFLKDESTRFGLPAFKILGASWAIYRSLIKRLRLDDDSSLENVKNALSQADGDGIRLVTCSEGNWGRACARMGKILGVHVTVHVPGFMSEYTRNLLREEGAEVRVLDEGSYDDAIAATREDADRTGALMVMDTSWEGYEEVPKWVTAGYSTMLTETDRQIAALAPDKPHLFFVSVGVGSWAHSVVAHYASVDSRNRIIAVEPTSAPSLTESLHVGRPTPVVTGDTIMAGMNCGTTSLIAWPVLRDGVSDVVVVTDWESHAAVEELKGQNVHAGPCGGATLAGLRKFVKGMSEEERGEMSVVLFSTEGRREYDIPE